MLAIAIILPVIIVILKAFLNYHNWLHNKPVKHTKEWVIMALCSVPSVYGFTQASALPWYFAAPISALMVAWFIWLMFDGLYNILREYNWWFTGSDDADDAATDNFIQQLDLWQHVVVKIGGNAIFITTYILTL
jgi:hypothetical protein